MLFNPDPYTLMQVVSALIYLLLLCGILLLCGKHFNWIPKLFLRSKRLIHRQTTPSTGSRLLTHLSGILSTISGKKVSPVGFIVLSLCMFLILFFLSVRTLALFHSFIIALAFALLPYLYLRRRLEKIRRRSSNEGEDLITAFLTQYWISACNVVSTLENLVQSDAPIKTSRRLLSSMLLDIRGTGSKQKIDQACERFSFAIGTSWSRMLSCHIAEAAYTGMDISLAIEDILAQLREARALSEERKRINAESVRITFYLIPLLYVGSLVASLTVLGLTPLQLLQRQFATPEGFGLFAMIVFLYILNSMLLEMATNRKLDF
jgi:ABC-type multidrug transport system fused ATPase/permease subunit